MTAVKKPQGYSLADVIRESRKNNPDIEITLESGKVVHAKAPALWPRELYAALYEGNLAAAVDVLFVEDDGYALCAAEGATPADIFMFIGQETGASIPESKASTGS